jgi:DNA uptake protein ComE-like DNA-binding protein
LEPPWKKTAPSVDEWLVEADERRPEDRETKAGPEDFVPDEAEAKPTPPPGESIGAETAQWIVPDLAPNGQTREEFAKAAAAAEESRKPAEADEIDGGSRAASPQGETAEANLRGGELGEIIAQLEARLEQESRRADGEAKRADEAAAKAAKLASQGKAAKTRTASRSKKLKKAEEQLKDLQRELKEREAEATKKLRAAEEDFDTRLSQMEADLTKQSEEREAELHDRIKELEAELAEAKKQKPAAKATATTRRRTTTAKATTSPARSKSATPSKAGGTRAARSTRAKRGAKNGKLDLNEAKFEELRELGLSVTQSARLIAYRDVRGGYDSLDELDEIPGLSAETRRELRGRLQLG